MFEAAFLFPMISVELIVELSISLVQRPLTLLISAFFNKKGCPSETASFLYFIPTFIAKCISSWKLDKLVGQIQPKLFVSLCLLFSNCRFTDIALSQ